MSERNRARHLRRRLKRVLRRHRWLMAAALLLVLAAAAAVLWLAAGSGGNTAREVTAARNPAGIGYREITYHGQTYRYNTLISTVLFAGVDSDEGVKTLTGYTGAPRADSITLVVMDEYHHRVTVVALNRNTVAKIRKYTLNGYDRGQFNDLLCYAYTYGNGGRVSSRNLCEAVSGMLYGVPVKEYVVADRSSLPVLAGILGPVEVTVPNGDLAELDPAFAEGARVTIDGSNLELFVRSRDTDAAFSNLGRMERQQAYIGAAFTRITTLAEKDPSGVWDRVQRAEDSILTNITRGRYMDLVNALGNTSGLLEYYSPAGESVMAGETSRFYADEEALLAKVIELFYIAD